MKLFLNKLLSTSTIALLTTASASWAAPIELEINGFVTSGMSGTVTKTSPAPVYTDRNVSAGQLEFNVISSSNPAMWNGTLQAFCIDVDTELVMGAATYDIVSATSPSGLTGLQNARVGWLYDNHAASLGSYGQFDAAFQLALWEIFFEENSTLSLSDGTFTSNDFGTIDRAYSEIHQSHLL